MKYAILLITITAISSNINIVFNQVTFNQNIEFNLINANLQFNSSHNISITNITDFPNQAYEINTFNNTKLVKVGAGGFRYWEFHGISLTVGWSILNFVGYSGARFLKHYTWWIYLHYIGSVLVTLWSFVILIISVIKCK